MMRIPNLYSRKNKVGKVYWRYRNPDGTFEELGSEELVAFKVALALNTEREEITRRLGKQSAKTLEFVIDQFSPVKFRNTNSDDYSGNIKAKLDRFKERLGSVSVSKIDISLLDDLFDKHHTTYESYRSNRILMQEVMTYAIGRGWRHPSLGNPAKDMLPPNLAREKGAKARRRLKFEQFEAVYENAEPWLRVAMDLALRFGIRRQDVVSLKFDNIVDGRLRFIPKKTQDLPNPAAISIMLDEQLSEIIEQARLQPPASPFIVHRSPIQKRPTKVKTKEHFSQVTPDYLSKGFAKARAKVEKHFDSYETKELPGFHEIRSLCARLYQEQKRPIEEVQLLLGHGSEEMTEWYQTNPDEITWQEVRAGLDLSRPKIN